MIFLRYFVPNIWWLWLSSFPFSLYQNVPLFISRLSLSYCLTNFTTSSWSGTTAYIWNTTIHYNTGNILFKKKKYSDALDVYMSALKVLPYDSKTLLNIAQVHLINWCHAMLFVKNPILYMISKLQKHMHLNIDFIYFIFLNSSYLESLRACIDYAIDRCLKVF